MKNVAVVLSGCGFKDGAEITEAVSTLIALTEKGCVPQCFAPKQKYAATNHATGQATEDREALAEAARIARGNIKDIKELKASDYDAIVFPGGYGAAMNLCDWGKKGSAGDINADVKRVIEDFYSQKKPIGAICIAPVLVAKVLGPKNVTLTIGNDKETAQEIEKTGAKHQNCAVTDCVVDKNHRIVTTPAYMYEAKPFEVFTGVRKTIEQLLAL